MTTPEPIHRGKVRDTYDAGDGRLLLVTSDRLSAFDVVAAEPVPCKGRVLNGVSNFWFDRFSDVPNHVISTDPDDFPAELQDIPDLEGRAVLVHRAEMLPIEFIVRGNLTGSGLKDYRKSGGVCGIPLPEGLEESETLEKPLLTPSTKEEEHDRNIPFDEAVTITEARFSGRGRELMEEGRGIVLDFFDRGRSYAAQCGIVIADTKFELGLVNGKLVVCDEVLTPDSSRFWPADKVVLGQTPPSFDKQPVRDYLDQLGWDHNPPMPPLPLDVIGDTTGRYVEAYRILTGQVFPYTA